MFWRHFENQPRKLPSLALNNLIRNNRTSVGTVGLLSQEQFYKILTNGGASFLGPASDRYKYNLSTVSASPSSSE
uniref:Uncharacterized protein n=1 Tax=Arundo donax TaxID=35708 RepID=A0A0A9DFY7_ARUDO